MDTYPNKGASIFIYVINHWPQALVFAKNPPINNVSTVNELNALITDTDWLWIKSNNLQYIDYMRLTSGQR